jgi:transcriptional regulator with XRE-family HTH domain
MIFDESAYQRILGDELLALRLRRGWTREHLRKHLLCDKSTQTLGFYEQGARNISVVRLADLCNAMGERPHDLLARVHNRLEQPGKILLDLARVAASTHPDLQPLRNWARDRLTSQNPESPPERTIQVNLTAFDAMATLCGMTTAELTDHLQRTAP